MEVDLDMRRPIVNWDTVDNPHGEELARKSGELVTGTIVLVGENGVVLSETEFLEGYKHGIDRERYPSGCLLREENFWKGRHLGECKEWHENGQLRFWSYVIAGVDLETKNWDEEGQLTSHQKVDVKSLEVLMNALPAFVMNRRA